MNGKLRDEFLNIEPFETLVEAQVLAENYRIEYNTIRPHASLGQLMPAEFAARRRSPKPASSHESQGGSPLRTSRSGSPPPSLVEICILKRYCCSMDWGVC